MKQGLKDVITYEVNKALLTYKTDPCDLLNIGDQEGEYTYLLGMRESYERTIYDIVSYYKDKSRINIKILELGAYLGIVSIVLSRFKFCVTAVDIEEFMSNKKLQSKYKKSNVGFQSVNLRENKLPFKDGEFDVVIMCDVLEHLNFNPLPAIQEINRIIKPAGLFYLSLPNIARGYNRFNLVLGNSIHNPINDFFLQLDPNSNMIGGIHWREYTGNEVFEILQRLGFKIITQKYASRKDFSARINLSNSAIWLVHKFMNLPLIRRVIYKCLFNPFDPALCESLVTISEKDKTADVDFHFTDATKY